MVGLELSRYNLLRPHHASLFRRPPPHFIRFFFLIREQAKNVNRSSHNDALANSQPKKVEFLLLAGIEKFLNQKVENV